jgi:hypothetical protein
MALNYSACLVHCVGVIKSLKQTFNPRSMCVFEGTIYCGAPQYYSVLPARFGT